jgi:predicted nucleotidyltransferase
VLKTGKFRALRNIPVGWVFQALHSTDLSERLFRMALEGCFFLMVWSVFFKGQDYSVFKAFVVVHTLNWFMTGNFWVYMLDSFKWVKNPGIKKLTVFIKHLSVPFEYLDCCDAILIYGSMCRNQFHIRSDLDVRIIRRSDSKFGLVCLTMAFLIRFYSFFRVIPVDLQVVDSTDFLQRQMRSDEKPIVVYRREGVFIGSEGRTFSEIMLRPESVLKCE